MFFRILLIIWVLLGSIEASAQSPFSGGGGVTAVLGTAFDTEAELAALFGNCLMDGQSYDVTTTGGTVDLSASDVVLPSIPSSTLVASELNDTADPHLLTTSELQGFYISNSASAGADEWDFPAAGEGWEFCFIKEVDQNVSLHPAGTEQWWFRTSNAAYTQLAAGEKIVNTTAGKSMLCCFSTSATGVYCTGDVNWAEETP